MDKTWFRKLEESVKSASECKLIKQNVKRKVFHLDGFYIKEVRYKGLRRILKTISGSTACREGQMNLRLKKLGIAVPDVIGYGMQREMGLVKKDVLVTGAVPSSQNLDNFLKGTFQSLSVVQKRQLIIRFASFVKKLHKLGIFHPDLHVGNILIAQSDDTYRFALLDTDRISITEKGLSRNQEIRSLALLLNSVRILSSTLQRFRFLKEYGVQLDGVGRQLVKSIQKKHLSMARKVWAGKAIRCLSSNSRFVAKRHGKWSTYRMREGLSERDFVKLLDAPDCFLEDGKILKAGNTVCAGVITLGGQNYFLKRYNCKGWWYRFRNAFRKSRAVRTWHNIWALHVRNLPIPTPLACFESRDFRLLGSSYILMEYLPDCTILVDAWEKADAEQKKSLLSNLAIVLGELHRTMCIHGDLKWNNILIPKDSSGRVILTDLDGCRILKKADLALFRKDLERFLRDLRQSDEGTDALGFFIRIWNKPLS